MSLILQKYCKVTLTSLHLQKYIFAKYFHKISTFQVYIATTGRFFSFEETCQLSMTEVFETEKQKIKKAV